MKAVDPALLAQLDQHYAQSSEVFDDLVSTYETVRALTGVDAATVGLVVKLGDGEVHSDWLIALATVGIRRAAEERDATRTVPCALCGLPVAPGEATHQTCSPRVVGR